MIARLDGTAALVTGSSAPRQPGRAGERDIGFPHLATTPSDGYLRLDDDQDHRFWSAEPGCRRAQIGAYARDQTVARTSAERPSWRVRRNPPGWVRRHRPGALRPGRPGRARPAGRQRAPRRAFPRRRDRRVPLPAACLPPARSPDPPHRPGIMCLADLLANIGVAYDSRTTTSAAARIAMRIQRVARQA
jgi:hypothetical protein